MNLILQAATLLLICATVIQPSQSAMTLDQIRSAGKMARKACQPKTGADTAALDRLKVGKFDENPDPKTKCYVNCVQNIMQVTKKDGHFDFDKALKQLNKALMPEHKEAGKNSINKCRTSADHLTDPCEISYAVLKCAYTVEPEIFFFP